MTVHKVDTNTSKTVARCGAAANPHTERFHLMEVESGLSAPLAGLVGAREISHAYPR